MFTNPIKLLGFGEPDGLVAVVEDGEVFAHEDVSNNPEVWVAGDIDAHDARHALSLSQLSYFQDVVVGREGVFNGHILEGVEGGAVHNVRCGHFGCANHGVDLLSDLAWSSNQRSARVNSGWGLSGDFDFLASV